MKNKKTKILNIGTCVENIDIANRLNDHFMTVGEKLSSKIELDYVLDMHSNDPVTSFNLSEISFDEVAKLSHNYLHRNPVV